MMNMCLIALSYNWTKLYTKLLNHEFFSYSTACSMALTLVTYLVCERSSSGILNAAHQYVVSASGMVI